MPATVVIPRTQFSVELPMKNGMNSRQVTVLASELSRHGNNLRAAEA